MSTNRSERCINTPYLRPTPGTSRIAVGLTNCKLAAGDQAGALASVRYRCLASKGLAPEGSVGPFRPGGCICGLGLNPGLVGTSAETVPYPVAIPRGLPPLGDGCGRDGRLGRESH